MRKTALTIAGSDSSGGAGIIANPNTRGNPGKDPVHVTNKTPDYHT